MSSVEVIIVNYRSTDLALSCLDSLDGIRNDGDRIHVSLVENCSPDDSLIRLRSGIGERGWTEWVELLPASRNGGFAYGNNLAIRKRLAEPNPPDFFWLLNPDTLVHPHALRSLVSYLDQHPQVGIVGSQLIWPNGEYPTSVFRFFSILGEFERGIAFGPISRLLDRYRLVPPQPQADSLADWVPGASMLIRRSVFEAIGLLDESYFMYYEETDFCLRARRAGILCGFNAASHVVHLEGQSSGIRQASDKPTKPLPQYWFDSRQRYFRKNYGRLYAVVVDLAWSVGHLVKRVRKALLRRPNQDPPGLLRGTLASTFRRLR